MAGRLLHDGEEVHHKNENKLDNRPENLRIMNATDHNSLHSSAPAYVELVCPQCKTTFARRANQRPAVKGAKRAFCGRSCSGKFYSSRKVRRR